MLKNLDNSRVNLVPRVLAFLEQLLGSEASDPGKFLLEIQKYQASLTNAWLNRFTSVNYHCFPTNEN